MNTSPLAVVLAAAFAVAAFPSHADQLKAKASALSQQDAVALQGKTLAIALHERESFVAMTAGKAMFGLLGVAGMVKAGNDFVEENQIPDPTLLVRDELANALRDQFGATLLPADTVVTASVKPADLVKAHPGSDYILSVRHRGSNYAYYPGTWGGYWIGNTVNVQLIETRSGRILSKGHCYASTHKNAVRPTLDQLRENGAQLTKDVLASLAWRCARHYALEGFGIAADRAPAIPQGLEDPLAKVGGNATAPVATPATTATEKTSPAPTADVPASDASAATDAPTGEAPATGVPAEATQAVDPPEPGDDGIDTGTP